MQSDFTLFGEPLAEACRLRYLKHEKLCASVGLGARSTIDLGYTDLKALDIYRLAQIADRLDVSIVWPLGRTNQMELPNGKGKGKGKAA